MTFNSSGITYFHYIFDKYAVSKKNHKNIQTDKLPHKKDKVKQNNIEKIHKNKAYLIKY